MDTYKQETTGGNQIEMPEIKKARRIYKAIRDGKIDATHKNGAGTFKTINAIRRYLEYGMLIEDVKAELEKRKIKLDFVEDSDIEYIVRKMKHKDMEEIIKAIQFKEENDVADAMNDWLGN